MVHWVHAPSFGAADWTEQVRVVRLFTGQSLSVPDGATVLMALSPTSREAATPDDLNAEDAAARKVEGAKPLGTHSQSVANRAQGLAMRFGKGRIVVLGEAGLLSAQLIRFPDGREVRFGMNVPGYRQSAIRAERPSLALRVVAIGAKSHTREPAVGSSDSTRVCQARR